MTLVRNHRYWWALGFFFLSLLPIIGKSSADRSADQILGRWLFPAKGSSVEVYRNGDRYFARIADVSQTGSQFFGLEKDQLLMRDLVFDGKSWSGGELIHPKTGQHFGIELKLVDAQTMTATVYKGCKWLHKEFVLTRPTKV
ncbi:hypothetical protein GCM10028807_49730 [Spirosoma daeguense]